LLQVIGRANGAPKLLGRVRRSEASLSPRGELGGLDEVLGLLDGT
jgi:hypothetical protein